MTERPRLAVSVICAWPDRTWQRDLLLPAGSTVAEALAASGWREDLVDPGLLPDGARFGIFGRLVDLAQALGPGDRVEIYRPLLADPQTVRRRRAAGLP
jgi:putative ubiquitin-RnfH superfamily antitoxin RatB of RatAB toxin-antitoxin module